MIKLDREELQLVRNVLTDTLDGVQVDNKHLEKCIAYIESITPKVPKYKVGDLVFWKERCRSPIYDAIIVRLPFDGQLEYTIALPKYSVIRFVPENQLFLTFKEAMEAKL